MFCKGQRSCLQAHMVWYKPKETKYSPVQAAQIGVGIRQKSPPIPSPLSHPQVRTTGIIQAGTAGLRTLP